MHIYGGEKGENFANLANNPCRSNPTTDLLNPFIIFLGPTPAWFSTLTQPLSVIFWHIRYKPSIMHHHRHYCCYRGGWYRSIWKYRQFTPFTEGASAVLLLHLLRTWFPKYCCCCSFQNTTPAAASFTHQQFQPRFMWRILSQISHQIIMTDALNFFVVASVFCSKNCWTAERQQPWSFPPLPQLFHII